MDLLEIQIKSKFSFNDLKLKLKLNEVIIPHKLVDDKILVETEIQFGLNKLSIQNMSELHGLQIEIVDFTLNTAGLRDSLYLAYHENPKTNSTWITDEFKELIIPFGNPISWWLAVCSKKISIGQYGTNLYEKYNIFYPESIDIDTSFPRIARDFMKYNFGFHIYDKSEPILHNPNIQYVDIRLNYDEEKLYEEFSNNIDLLQRNYYDPRQNIYNQKEVNNEYGYKEPWLVAAYNFHEQQNDQDINEIEKSKDQLQGYFTLLDNLKSMNIKILHSFISVAYPNQSVTQHLDDHTHIELYKNTTGCSQMFIPIGWDSKSYFKLLDLGFIPTDKPKLFNANKFMHGSINASDKIRFTIGILCDLTEKNLKQLTN